MEQLYEAIGKILGGAALLIATMSVMLWKKHGARCEEVQREKVSREEFNKTVESLRTAIADSAKIAREDMFNNVESLRSEIRAGYQHIEHRIDNGNSDTHKRIDRLLERRDINGRT